MYSGFSLARQVHSSRHNRALDSCLRRNDMTRRRRCLSRLARWEKALLYQLNRLFRFYLQDRF